MSSEPQTPPQRHFQDAGAVQTTQEHMFEQLNLDLQWATDDIVAFMQRESLDPVAALYHSFRNIAGRRWSRFKTAEEEKQEARALEMEMFSRFWYRLADRVASVKPDVIPKA